MISVFPILYPNNTAKEDYIQKIFIQVLKGFLLEQLLLTVILPVIWPNQWGPNLLLGCPVLTLLTAWDGPPSVRGGMSCPILFLVSRVIWVLSLP